MLFEVVAQLFRVGFMPILVLLCRMGLLSVFLDGDKLLEDVSNVAVMFLLLLCLLLFPQPVCFPDGLLCFERYGQKIASLSNTMVLEMRVNILVLSAADTDIWAQRVKLLV